MDASHDEGATQNSAVLIGGPDRLPAHERRRRVPHGESKVKVPFQNGYEHFVADELPHPLDGHAQVFRWAMRTEIAE
ncbi:DUF5988 family protein [Actinomadura roseirufa]|uniref:DUF5988 family protein n=1 Tax=Actinomadura roseirufa TaxID=2094049 RepID=UPI0010413D5D|nr:DUF5988 family protein [Actinomadura roseirufa]